MYNIQFVKSPEALTFIRSGREWYDLEETVIERANEESEDITTVFMVIVNPDYTEVWYRPLMGDNYWVRADGWLQDVLLSFMDTLG